MKKYLINSSLYLKRISIEDVAEFNKIASNPNVTKYLRYPTHQNINETINVIENLFAKDKEPWSHLGIFKDDKLIGEINISSIKDGSELGYQLNEDFWGQGIAFKAASKIISIFFENKNNDKVYVTADKENSASWKVIKKLGFQESDKPINNSSNWWVLSKESFNKKII